MLKTVFITLNIIGILALPMIYTTDVSIIHEGENAMSSGNSQEITITISKGDITGPGRLKLSFEDAGGLSFEEGESDGSSVTNKNSIVTYIWHDIPIKETLNLTYKIKANSPGNQKITGTFLYMDGTERKQLDIPVLLINVDGEALATNNTTNEPNVELPKVEIKRTITPDNNNFIVELSINKGQAEGFARIKETIPEGFTAENIDGNGSVFKFVNGTVKYLWTALPKDKETIKISYRITPFATASGTFNITGSFSGEFLIVNDKPHNIDIAATSLNVSQSDLAVNNNESSTQETSNSPEQITDKTTENDKTNTETAISDPEKSEIENNKTPDKSVTSNNTQQENTNNTATNENNLNTNETADKTEKTEIITNSGNNGISYRVQLLAAHKTVDNKFIARHYNGYEGKINLENHEGWVKYTSEEVAVYKDARDKRNSLKAFNFPGPFVTAYNNSNRITVQEALMISNQKWYQ